MAPSALGGGAAPRPSGGAPRLGVFIGFIDDSFQRTVWRSIVARARERGAGAIGFFGHGLGSPEPSRSTMNVAYRLARPANVDACVVLSNTVGNFTGPEGVARLVAEVGLPAVSIGFPIPGAPSVRARGGDAMTELARHLVRDHGRRRLALVTGPERHPDSIERESAFRAVLAEAGLPLPQELVYRGKFYKESGAEAARSFLGSGIPFDAVVCLNDYMALGAMEELRAQGVAAPSQVSVTGFDDVAEARWAPCPLTTARQSLERLGSEAVDMALDLLAGRAPPSRSFGCECVYRRSCGCPPALPLSEGVRSPGGTADFALSERIRSAAASGDPVAAVRILEEAIPEETGGAAGGEAFEALRRSVYLARRGAFPPAGPRGAREGRDVDCFDQAFAFLNQVERRMAEHRGIAEAERGVFLRLLSSKLLGTFSPGALARNWEDCVGPLGFRRGYLALFLPPVAPGGLEAPAKSVLLTSSPGSSGEALRTEFRTELLVPPELDIPWGEDGWLLEPLVYRDEALGYILLEGGPEEANAYETLRMELSTAVKATLLMEEIRESEKGLERLVELRTRELKEANEDLREQIERRRGLELEVQEISNRTMQAIGQDIHDDLCQHLVGISMLAAVAEENLRESGSVSPDSIREIRGLLESAVSRSRQFARTLYPPALDELGFVSALEDLVETLGRSPGGASLSFQKEGDCRLDDSAVALQLYRIVQEALTNALRHSGSEAVILRLVGRGDGSLTVEVRDFGVGMGALAESRGMGLRIMRYRAESIGARLEIGNLDPGVCVSCSLGA